MNSPADERYCPEGDALKETAAFYCVNDLLRQNRLLSRTEAGSIHNSADQPLCDVKQGHHQFQSIGDNAFGNGKPDEQLERVFRLFDLGKAAAGFHHTYNKE